MKNSSARLLIVALTLVSLSGCATLTTSSSQTVTLVTDPAGAACTFKREGKVVGIVNPTPGSLMVSKSHSALDVACVKEGYVDAAGTVGSKFQAMTFGNILFGGIIGIAVDAASGATAEYEPTITIRLTPSEFADTAARDTFFAQQRDTFVAQARQVRQRIVELCGSGGRASGAGSFGTPTPPDCSAQLRQADEEEKSGLARIETQRQTAKIKTP